MNYETFKWIPLVEAEEEIEPLIDIIQLGNGVEQRQAKGLRRYRTLFNDQKFISNEAEIDEIAAFLMRHLTQPFYYNIGGKRYLVRKDGPFKIIRKGADIAELTASFVEVVR